jgi:RimJ/RimL family protein N-acetyltransferase
MIEFEQATSEHVLSIKPQDSQSEIGGLELGRAAIQSGHIPLDGRAIAITDQGVCIGAYGYVEMWQGVARIWALFSDELLTHYAMALSKNVRSLLLEDVNFHRIEATCHHNDKKGALFLEWLGFEQEGLMKGYGPTGENFYLYARTRDVI